MENKDYFQCFISSNAAIGTTIARQARKERDDDLLQ